jgi:FKBP-type peptidyl-prolyl cis-trans isomerase FkpA
MKKNKLLFCILTTVAIASCAQVDFKRTKSGLLYKIIHGPGGNSSDSTAKPGNVLKLYFTQKINDSVLSTNYGKMPTYAQIPPSVPQDAYNPSEIFTMLRKGDSVNSVILVDSLLAKKQLQQLPPFMKKGDRITITFRVVDVFRSDSAANMDSQKELAIEKTRLEKESAVEAVKEDNDLQAWLKKKNISTQRAPRGTYVHVTDAGSGEVVAPGKTVTVKYTGKRLENEEVFQSNEYTFVIGSGQVIPGWDDGLQLFKKGGKGTLYIPGVLAYGATPQPGSPFKPNDALIFDVEVTDVKNTPAPATPQLNIDTTQRHK